MPKSPDNHPKTQLNSRAEETPSTLVRTEVAKDFDKESQHMNLSTLSTMAMLVVCYLYIRRRIVDDVPGKVNRDRA